AAGRVSHRTRRKPSGCGGVNWPTTRRGPLSGSCCGRRRRGGREVCFDGRCVLVPRLRLGTHCREALPREAEPRIQRVPRRSLGTRELGERRMKLLLVFAPVAALCAALMCA